MSTYKNTAEPRARQQRTASIAGAQANPVTWWASIGVLITLFQFYVWGSWINSGPARVVPLNPSEMEPLRAAIFHSLEFISPLLCSVCLWYFLLKPLIREKRLAQSGLVILMMPFLYFWDPSAMYFTTWEAYSSYFTSWGNWMGYYPGEIATNVGSIPEPVFLMLPGYTWQVGVPVLIMLWGMRKCKERYPNASTPQMIAAGIVFGCIYDFVYEVPFLRTQIWSYWGSVGEWSLWGGHWYQFPLYEIAFWGLTTGLFASVLYFTNDKGQTFVERGLERLRYGTAAKGVIRFFALLGIFNLIYLVGFTMPMNLFTIHSGPPPADTPAHLVNGVCGPDTHYACPSADLPINRAGANIFVGPGLTLRSKQ